MARSNLRVVNSYDSTEGLLFRANEYLGSGETSKALHLYTEVLYKTCPGHVFAFLNRAIAYSRLGYPELAVVDAYRAAISSHEMRDLDSVVATGRLRTCVKYLRTEKLHWDAEAYWTLSKESEELSDLLAGITSNITAPSIDTYMDIKKRNTFCSAIEYRAIYRMCDALQQCGGGAMNDALGMISDSFSIRTVGLSERNCAFRLGEEIMKAIEARYQKDEHKSFGLAQYQDVTMKESMQSKATMVNREIYPWNNKELDANDYDVLRFIGVENYTDDCLPRMKKSEDGCTPHLELCAIRDIYPCTEVLSEHWRYIVSTDDPFPLNDAIAPAPPPVENVHPCSPRSLYSHPKAQSLYDRLLHRIIGKAIDTDTHPLDDEVIRFLNGNFHQRSNPAQDRKALPWTFANNVIRPLHYIHEYRDKRGQSAFQRLELLDGWVINTLLAKIQRSARIQSGHIYVEAPPGSDSYSYIRKVRPSHPSPPGTSYPSPRNPSLSNHEPWIASLSPIFSTIRVADPTRGETPNVSVHERRGISCATLPGNLNLPAITAGEPVLRRKDPFPGTERAYADDSSGNESELDLPSTVGGAARGSSSPTSGGYGPEVRDGRSDNGTVTDGEESRSGWEGFA